jgi:hypothetical protein
MPLGNEPTNRFCDPRDDLNNAPANITLPSRSLAVGDFGAHDVAGDGAAVFALGDKQVFGPAGSVGTTNPKPRLL